MNVEEENIYLMVNALMKYQIVFIIPLKLNVLNAQKIIKLLMENAFTVIIHTLAQMEKLVIYIDIYAKSMMIMEIVLNMWKAILQKKQKIKKQLKIMHYH